MVISEPLIIICDSFLFAQHMLMTLIQEANASKSYNYKTIISIEKLYNIMNVGKGVMLLVVLDCALIYFPGKACINPRKTSTKVVPSTFIDFGYQQKYVMVHWCLYPCEPLKNEIKHFYVQVQHHVNHTRLFFEIDNHKNCSSGRYSSQIRGHELIRKEYIRPSNSSHITRKGFRCNCGPQVFQQWLGKTSLHLVNPWQKVKRCSDEDYCVPTVKNVTIHRVGHINGTIIPLIVQNHTECRVKSYRQRLRLTSKLTA